MERAGRLIGKLRIPSDTVDMDLLARRAWAPAVGKRIAAHTRAVRLVRQSLIVEVEDPVWQQHLHTLRAYILKNVNGLLGDAVITDLDFRPMTPRRAPQLAHGLFGAASTGASDPADGIQDPVFRRLYIDSRKRTAKAAL